MNRTLRKLHRHKRDGFLLLTVVVMLAVTTLILARLASTSMRIASQAVEDEKRVRNQWAITSLRRFTLNAGRDLLASSSIVADQGSSQSETPVLWKDVVLANQTWRVVLSDESAKLNLNALAEHFEYDAVEQQSKELITGAGLVQPKADLESVIGSRSTRWDAWLDSPSKSAQNRNLHARRLSEATQRITLWGDGRLNVCTSDSKTLDGLWKQLFGRQPPKLLDELRKQRPVPERRRVIEALGLRGNSIGAIHQSDEE